MIAVRVSRGLAVPRGGHTKRQEGVCRLCLRPARVRPLTLHHLVPQAWFAARLHGVAGEDWYRLRALRDADANLIPLCRPCHDDVECDPKIRRMLRRRLTQAEITFAVQVRGLDWLDDRYPGR